MTEQSALYSGKERHGEYVITSVGLIHLVSGGGCDQFASDEVHHGFDGKFNGENWQR